MEEEEEVMVLVNGKEIALDAVTEEHQEQMSKEVSLSPFSLSLPSPPLVHPPSLPPSRSPSSLAPCIIAGLLRMPYMLVLIHLKNKTGVRVISVEAAGV
jgi:hypothetical protein